MSLSPLVYFTVLYPHNDMSFYLYVVLCPAQTCWTPAEVLTARYDKTLRKIYKLLNSYISQRTPTGADEPGVQEAETGHLVELLRGLWDQFRLMYLEGQAAAELAKKDNDPLAAEAEPGEARAVNGAAMEVDHEGGKSMAFTTMVNTVAN